MLSRLGGVLPRLENVLLRLGGVLSGLGNVLSRLGDMSVGHCDVLSRLCNVLAGLGGILWRLGNVLRRVAVLALRLLATRRERPAWRYRERDESGTFASRIPFFIMNSFICGHYIKKRERCEAVCCLPDKVNKTTVKTI
jgi:hypothetical protein